jgi:hypothetical protein
MLVVRVVLIGLIVTCSSVGVCDTVVLIWGILVVDWEMTGGLVVPVVSVMRVGLIRARIPMIRVTPSPCPSDTRGARFETPNAVGNLRQRTHPTHVANHNRFVMVGNMRPPDSAPTGRGQSRHVAATPGAGGSANRTITRSGWVSPDRPHSLRSETPEGRVKSGRCPRGGERKSHLGVIRCGAFLRQHDGHMTTTVRSRRETTSYLRSFHRRDH